MFGIVRMEYHDRPPPPREEWGLPPPERDGADGHINMKLFWYPFYRTVVVSLAWMSFCIGLVGPEPYQYLGFL